MNCKRKIDFLKDYMVDCLDIQGNQDTYYMCSSCINILPKEEKGYGCNICGKNVHLTNQMIVRHIPTGYIIRAYNTDEECFMELFGSIYTISLEDSYNEW